MKIINIIVSMRMVIGYINIFIIKNT